MQRYFPAFFLLVASLFVAAPAARAQSAVLNLPRPSQHARVMQRVGITDITIDYSRPLVKGRKIWGGLVPYGEVWRGGANENTTITFTDPVTVEGKPLPKGTYGLHLIPGEKEWTVAFSKEAQAWGSFTYDQKEDALRITVKPQPAEMQEALSYELDDLAPDATTVTLRWEKLAVPFKVEVNTNEIVAESLHSQLRGLAQYTFEGWDDAANYFLQNKANLEEALKYSDRSIAVEERFDNLMTKAGILEALNRKQEAAATRSKALPLGNPLQLHGYGRQLQQQGKQEQAFEIYRANIKKFPDNWVAHNEMARLACAEGKFDDAAKHMKLSIAVAPDSFKPALEALVKRLEAKEDINR